MTTNGATAVPAAGRADGDPGDDGPGDDGPDDGGTAPDETGARGPGAGRPGRLDRFQRRHPWAGFPVAVVYKLFDDMGTYLAALITYYAFVSLFPLLLLVSTVLGWVLAGDTGLQHRILASALAQFPVIGPQLADPKRLGGGIGGLVVGVLGALYGALGVAQAMQYAMNTAWRVPRNSRPNPLKARGRSLLLLGTIAVAALGTTLLSILGSSTAGSLGPFSRAGVLVGSLLVNAGAFAVVFRLGTTRPLSFRDVLPGAIGAAVAWQLLQSFGVVYVDHVIRGASATNGVFGLVLGLLAFLYLAALAVVVCVEVDVVRVDRLHPRALPTPFTDNVALTGADERAYTGQARAERAKGFERIDVEFRDHGDGEDAGDGHDHPDAEGEPGATSP